MVEGLVCLSDWLRAKRFQTYKEPTKDEMEMYEELEKLEIGKLLFVFFFFLICYINLQVLHTILRICSLTCFFCLFCTTWDNGDMWRRCE